jgi:hypothetical protein
MSAFTKRASIGFVLLVVALLSHGCVQFAMTLLTERRLDVLITSQAGQPIPKVEVRLFRNVHDWVHGNKEESVLAPNFTDVNGRVALLVPYYSPVIVKVNLPDGTQTKSIQPWPQSGGTLHVVVETGTKGPERPSER